MYEVEAFGHRFYITGSSIQTINNRRFKELNNLNLPSLKDYLERLFELEFIIGNNSINRTTLITLFAEPDKNFHAIRILYLDSNINFQTLNLDFKSIMTKCKKQMTLFIERHFVKKQKSLLVKRKREKLEVNFENLYNFMKNDFEWLNEKNGTFIIKGIEHGYQFDKKFCSYFEYRESHFRALRTKIMMFHGNENYTHSTNQPLKDQGKYLVCQRINNDSRESPKRFKSSPSSSSESKFKLIYTDSDLDSDTDSE